jgi:hypothetical protein
MISRWKARQINHEAILSDPPEYLANLGPAVRQIGQAMTYLQAAGPDLDKKGNWSITIPLRPKDGLEFDMVLTKDDIRGLEGSMKLLMALDSYSGPLMRGEVQLAAVLTDETDKDNDLVLSAAEYAPVLVAPGAEAIENRVEIPPDIPEEEKIQYLEEMAAASGMAAGLAVGGTVEEVEDRAMSQFGERTVLMLQEGSRLVSGSMKVILDAQNDARTLPPHG